MRAAVVAASIVLSIVGLSGAGEVSAAVKRLTNIPPQPLEAALETLAKERDFQILYRADVVGNRQTQGAAGEFTLDEALTQLLSGTGLTFRYLRENSVTVFPVSGQPTASLEDAWNTRGSVRLGQAESPRSGTPSGGREREGITASETSSSGNATVASGGSQDLPAREDTGKPIPEILVRGSKTLNMDLARSRNGTQPYVIFNRTDIESSGAATLEDFLKRRLTMNTQAGTNSQSLTALGNTSQINLRGFGTNQTLILVDGHRVASPAVNGSPFQPDINGLPLAAIERIEVLPTTASGIYGGGATGGVVNIVRRRDYEGAEVKLGYESGIDSAFSIGRVDMSAGFSLESDRTNVLLTGSWADNSGMLVGDRDLIQRGRSEIFAHNPSFFLGASPPPLGTTTNIRSANGSPLFGPGTPSTTFVPVGYAGGGGLAPFQPNAGQYNLGLGNSVQTGGAKSGLTNGSTVESFGATVRRQFSSSVELFVEGNASNNDGKFPTSAASGVFTVAATAPNNPFGQTIQVTTPTSDADVTLHTHLHDRRLLGGAIVKLPHDWSAEADYTWDRTRYSSHNDPFAFTSAAATAVSNGTLDVLRDTNLNPLDFAQFIDPNTVRPVPPIYYTLRDATARVAGPIFDLPAGPLTLSGLLEHRAENLTETRIVLNPTLTLLTPPRSQSVDSIYMEANVPLFSARKALPGVRELDLQLAARRDHYEVNGTNGNIVAGSTTPVVRTRNEDSSTDPSFGLRYRPVDDVMLRVSYGTGFVPPQVNQLVPNPPTTVSGLGIDPRRGNEPLAPTLRQTGGNPNLLPESSESWSAGLVFTPRFAEGLRLSVDYTFIEKTDNIVTISTQQIIDNEAILPGRIVRNPPAPGDPFGVGTISFIDATQVNIAKAEAEAFDVQLDYQRDSSIGSFNFFLLATWQNHFKTQLIPQLPVVDNVGVTSAFPLELRGNAGLSWSRGSWMVGWAARYFDSYLVANPAISTSATVFSNQGGRSVPHQVYHDAFVSYRWDDPVGVLDGAEIQLALKNIFDREPPFDASQVYFYSPYGDPQLASYALTLKMLF